MIKKLRYLYEKTFLRNLMFPLKWIYDIYWFRIVSDKKFIRERYKLIMDKYPNLENPKLFSEKIQWLKLNDRKEFYTTCADKYKSREYISQKIGKEYLVPLVFETKRIEDININNMPNYPIAVKTNHDSSGAEIIREKHNVDYKSLQNKLKKLLKINYYHRSREWPYKNIERRILVEKLLLCKDNKLPNDYKFHCFNGKPKIVYVSVDVEGEDKRNIYSESWEPLMFSWIPKGKKVTSFRGKELPEPKNYNKMLKIAEKLSEDFKYIRIDLYNVDGKIYCGELTFYHGSGTDIIHPKEWDRRLGDMIEL